MSDNEIREILAERKRRERRMQRREAIIEMVGGITAWGGLFFIGFMLAVIGG